MRIADYKLIFIGVGLVGILLIATPALGMVVHLPGEEPFSELYILGPGHMAENYAFKVNVTSGKNYSVYLGVGDHLGFWSSAYYLLYVKFRNMSDPLPNSTLAVPSSLPPLYEYRVVLKDGRSWEAPLSFSFSDVSFSENKSRVGVLQINGVEFNVSKESSWDTRFRGFYYQLFVELWIYDAKFQTFYYHNRFVSLRLNMTA